MAFYCSLKSLPELRGWNWKDRCDAMWQAGLRPFRRWQVWAAMALSSLAALWALDMLAGSLLVRIPPDPFGTDIDYDGAFVAALATVLALLAAVCIPAVVVWRTSYLKAMRPLLPRIFPDPDVSAPGAAARWLAIHLLFLLLTGAWVGALDWAINAFDEDPDPRIAQTLAWPEPIPDRQNGYVALAGLLAPPGTDPLDAGRLWLAAWNDANLRHAKQFPAEPSGLGYVPYGAPPGAQDGAPPGKEPGRSTASTNTPGPCAYGRGACLEALRAGRGAVQRWLGANRELLARYVALQQYPAWQNAMRTLAADAPFPTEYKALLQAQDLLLATALLSIEDGKTGKGLDMLGADVRFVRAMLASRDALIGKMVATTMLARDLASLGELIESRPEALAPYWGQIDAMVAPLTPGELSCADALRFEQRWWVAILSSAAAPKALLSSGARAPALIDNPWVARHYSGIATANLMLRSWDAVILQSEVRDASRAPLLPDESRAQVLGLSPATGFFRNQLGKTLAQVAFPPFVPYLNKVRDVNALNSLVRLRMMIARNGIAAKDVPAWLARADAPQNPESGRAFDWDAQDRLVYFTPGVETFRTRYPLDSTQAGRTGLRIPVAPTRQ